MNSESKMTFGKYKDQPLAVVPQAYLVFLHDNKIGSPELLRYIGESIITEKSQSLLSQGASMSK